jgi:hypothetical protein
MADNQTGEYVATARSVGQILAEGDVTTKVGVLWFMGAICVLLIIGGILVFFLTPQSAKDVW